jgi:signal transduction histidine kinase
VTALTWAYRAIGYPGEAPGTALFVTCYAVAAHAAGRWWVGQAVAATGAAMVVPLLPPHPVPVTVEAWAVFGPGIGMVTAALLGVSVRQRRAEAERRIRHAAERAEAEVARRLAAERLAVARELHDVLAHTIAVISVHSGLALDVLDDDPQRARPALDTVRASAREAIGQLRAAVRALRGDGAPPATTPLTLAALDRVADGARAAGWDVVIEAGPGAGDDVPPLLQAACYRIVQEALTNCLRHSAGTVVRVRLERSARGLAVEVVDDGCPAPGTRPEPADRGPGLGLVGIAERAAAVGGHAETGWLPGGGFRVAAVLPLPAGEA